MKNTISLLFFLGWALLSFGQNYGVGTSIGTTEPFLYTNTGITVLSDASNDVLSSTQTIPFSWNYYGTAVSSYKVSDNGYITFETSASVSDPVNTAIPNVGGPNNAIYAFWDDLNVASGSGTPDAVNSFNYGTAPNRTHVIQWYSVTPVSGTGFVFVAIRIHECGDFDVIHNFGIATGTTATVGCEDATGANGTMVQGPSYNFPTTQTDGADDIVYSFFWDGIDYDAAITSSNFGNYVNIGNNPVSGDFINKGAQAITSYDLNYSVDAGPAVTMNVPGVNIAALGGMGSYNHSTTLNIASGGELHTVCIWIDNINGNADQRTCNDELCKDVFSHNGTSASNINVVIEGFTAAWAGYCPDGHVVIEDLISQYPDKLIAVSVHDGDEMEYADGIRSEFVVTAYPNGMVDRKVFDGEIEEPTSRGIWAANVATQLKRYTPVEVGIDLTYNQATRTITATVTAEFADFAIGDMRFVMEVTEDNVTGVGDGYDQANKYNTTVGHPFEGAGDPIIGYNHRRVLRANEPGVYGNAEVIPTTVSPGSIYSETFTYVIPASYDETEISVIGFVSYSKPVIGQREILNADQKHLSMASAVDEVNLFGSLSISPNPADDQFTLVLNLRKAITANIVIYNTFGQKVKKIAFGTYAPGEHVIQGSVGDLSKGLYYITIHTGNHSLTKKLIVL